MYSAGINVLLIEFVLQLLSLCMASYSVNADYDYISATLLGNVIIILVNRPIESVLCH